MKFSQLCVAGALSLEVLSRGVNFASALKHDASKKSTATHLKHKDTQVLKTKKKKDSFKALYGHRAIEEDVNPNWELRADTLFESSTNCDNRGLSMSGDGKTFAIACKEDNTWSGRVKVYSLENGQWVPKGGDIVGQEGTFERLGSSVALSGDGSILAIGILSRDIETKTDAGCIEVYKYNGNDWTPMGPQINGENASESFGEKVSLSADGKILAGSGDLLDNGQKGFVRVYQFDDTKWTPLGVDLSGKNNEDKLGLSLSLSDNGKRMAIGSPGTDEEDDNTGSFSVYEYDDVNGWVLIGDTIHGDTRGSQLGYSIQISGDSTTIVVGAKLNGGYVMVYRLDNDNQWMPTGEPFNGISSDSGLGEAVSISKDGNTILASYLRENAFKGMVRSYKYSDNKWVQLGDNIYGTTGNQGFGLAAVLSADGNTLVAAGKYEGASVYTLPVTDEEWDGSWYINYDSANLANGVLTTSYLTKPGVDTSANVAVTHTDGKCDEGGETHDKSVITLTTSEATVVNDTIDDKLDVAKTLDAAVIASSHSGTFLFCETVTLTNSGLNIVDVQTQYTVKANFLATIGAYNTTLEDVSTVTTVAEQTMSVDGTVVVARCDEASDNINQGDILCLDISESDSTSVGVQSIYNLDLKPADAVTSFEAIDDGEIKYTDLVDVDCTTVSGTCKVNVVVPDTLFVNDNDSDAITFTLNISGDVYLYEMNGKDSESEPKGFDISVKLEKPCEGGFLRGVAEMLF